jgi:hypothetical protein
MKRAKLPFNLSSSSQCHLNISLALLLPSPPSNCGALDDEVMASFMIGFLSSGSKPTPDLWAKKGRIFEY